MTPQMKANLMLGVWRAQQQLPPDQRKLPQDNQSEAEWLAELEIIKTCMERRR